MGSPGPAVSNATQLYNILIIMHLNELNRSRDPLNDFASTLVCLAAILIILVNGMLCVFLIRDSRLWALRLNRMMVSLALADLLVGLTLIPQVVHEDWIVKQNVTHNLTGVETYKGTNNETQDDFDGTTCRLLSGMTWLSVTTSIYTFTLISIPTIVIVVSYGM